MSTLNVQTISDGTTTIGISSTAKTSAKAYVRCASNGNLAESYNISGVTIGANNNTYTFTFTNPMPNVGYSVIATVNTTSTTADGTCFVRSFTTNSFQVVVRDYDGSVATAGVSAVVYSN